MKLVNGWEFYLYDKYLQQGYAIRWVKPGFLYRKVATHMKHGIDQAEAERIATNPEEWHQYFID